MRFKIDLSVNGQRGRRLPLSYQYELSAAIYRILASGNEKYAEWLHDNGFQLENGKTFKLFTFSRLKTPKNGFTIIKQSNQLELLSNNVEWQISFLPEKSTQKFIEGIFQKRVFELGNRQSVVQFQVENIEMMSPPDYSDTMTFEALSPISVSRQLEDGRDYYPKNGDEFDTAGWVRERLLQNLLDKYEAIEGKPFNGKRYFNLITLLESKTKSSLVTIKAGTPQETKVRGFMCTFVLHCPVELMRIAYESGLGEGNSQGFGCLGRIR